MTHANGIDNENVNWIKKAPERPCYVVYIEMFPYLEENIWKTTRTVAADPKPEAYCKSVCTKSAKLITSLFHFDWLIYNLLFSKLDVFFFDTLIGNVKLIDNLGNPSSSWPEHWAIGSIDQSKLSSVTTITHSEILYWLSSEPLRRQRPKKKFETKIFFFSAEMNTSACNNYW